MTFHFRARSYRQEMRLDGSWDEHGPANHFAVVHSLPGGGDVVEGETLDDGADAAVADEFEGIQELAHACRAGAGDDGFFAEDERRIEIDLGARHLAGEDVAAVAG